MDACINLVKKRVITEKELDEVAKPMPMANPAEQVKMPEPTFTKSGYGND